MDDEWEEALQEEEKDFTYNINSNIGMDLKKVSLQLIMIRTCTSFALLRALRSVRK